MLNLTHYSLFPFSAHRIVNNEGITDNAIASRLDDDPDTEIYPHSIYVVDTATVVLAYPSSYLYVVLFVMNLPLCNCS